MMRSFKHPTVALTSLFVGVSLVAAAAYLAVRPADSPTSTTIDAELSAADLAAASAVAPVVTATPQLMVSTSANRAAATALQGGAVNGNVFIFVSAPADTKSVAFYLDDTKMARPPRTTERLAPYDFAGTAANSMANAYNATALTPGSHSVTARITPAAGADQIVHAAFTKSATSPQPNPVPVKGKKWHPGNYVNAYYGEGVGYAVKVVKETRDGSGRQVLRGFSVIENWAEIEPTKGNYNFTKIRNELAIARQNNMSMIIQVADKSFNGRHPNCVPADMRADQTLYKGGQEKHGTYCAALVWVPAVQARLNALYAALGKAFDGDPTLEAVMTEEDSIHQPIKLYTNAGFAAAQRSGLKALAAAFPRTVVFAFHNWGPEVPSLVREGRDLGIGLGGPDLDPKEKTFSTDLYTTYKGQIPLEISVQSPRVNKSISGGSSVTRMYDWAVSDPTGLHATHLVWDPTFFAPDNKIYDFTSMVLPVLKTRSGRTNTACPTRFTCQ